MLTKDAAICIRATDYSETSQIVTFFTKAAGKIGAIAKGSKRPKSSFDGPIEMFAHGRIVFSDSARERLATLTEFQQQPSFTHLADNLFTLNCASFAAELVNKLTDDCDPHPQLFDSFLQFLKDVQAASDKQQATISLLILFQLSLLKEIGLMPVFSHCANCKTQYAKRDTQYDFFFSSLANGLICRDCEASFPDRVGLSDDAANCLSDVKLLVGADVGTLNEVAKVLISHFTEILHRPPKMAKYVTLDS